MDITAMPRTKQVRKMSSLKGGRQKLNVPTSNGPDSLQPSKPTVQMLTTKEYHSADNFMEEFLVFHNEKIKEREEAYKKSVDCVKAIVNGLRESTASFNHLPVSEFEKAFKDTNQDLNFSVSENEHQSRLSRADKFEFVKPKVPTKKQSRSSSRKRSLSASAAIQTPQLFKTPWSSSSMLQSTGTITPKIYSGTPVTVMRRPGHGELAVSMSGSPLMVGPVAREDFPTLNVPMNDGRIFSILPEPGMPPQDLPEFDEATKGYLKTIRAHLEILAPSNTP